MAATTAARHPFKVVVIEYDQDPTGASSGGGQSYLVSVGAANDAVLQVTPYHRRDRHDDTGDTAARTNEQWSPDVSPPHHPSLSSKLLTLRRRLCQFWCDLLLPVGYPVTVRPGYASYQFYDSLQGLCSYLRGVLCHAAVLEAAGVGNADATAWAAAATWALKDGVALVGGLAYSYTVSNQFDTYVKEFRLFADIANDIGFLLDMMAPWFGHAYFLHVSAAAVLCKTLCGISAGATKSSITMHFAVAGNMADLNAKEGTQETLVSLVGMMLGVGAARTLRALDNNTTSSWSGWYNWILFLGLTILHVWANYQGVALLRLRTLNRARLDLVLAPLLQVVSSNNRLCTAANSALVPKPEQVHESLWYAINKFWRGTDRLRLGMPFTSLIVQQQWCPVSSPSTTTTPIVSSSSSLTAEQCNYCVALLRPSQRAARPLVGVTLRIGATPRDQFQAYVHAHCILAVWDEIASSAHNSQDTVAAAAAPPCNAHAIQQQAQVMVDELFNYDDDWLVTQLRSKGWDVDGPVYLGFSQRRSHWTDDNTIPLPPDVATVETKKDQ